MVFKRKSGTGWQFQARTRHGWKPLTFRSTKPKANQLAELWEKLAQQERAWDILDPILASPRGERQKRLGQLLDLWTETRHSLGELRRRLQDPDIEPYVAPWELVYALQRPKNAFKSTQRVRWLIPQRVPLLRSQVTTGWLTERLYAYKGKPGTLRGVHSAWSSFFQYLASVHGLFTVNPMSTVKRPPPAGPNVRFLEPDQVLRVLNWQTTQERSVFYAIAYGAGIESGVTLALTRDDVWDESHEIRAAGTKTATRDRVAIVADWAWPIIEGYVRTLLPGARLFPDWFRDDTVSRWHAETLKALGLPHMPLHNARHHWAVTRLRAGVPVAIVQQQLGHSTPVLTLKTYGAFIPTGQDRARWEAQTTQDSARRSAGRSANPKAATS
jgi:integrase